ncbi:hypothetical protein Dimus_011604 [Dionaea muscipula]
MATRSAAAAISLSSLWVRSMVGARRSSTILPRYFSEDGKGRVFSEEERAAETIYIQKMERERLEKAKLKADQEKAEKEKEHAGKDENPRNFLYLLYPSTSCLNE